MKFVHIPNMLCIKNLHSFVYCPHIVIWILDNGKRRSGPFRPWQDISVLQGLHFVNMGRSCCFSNNRVLYSTQIDNIFFLICFYKKYNLHFMHKANCVNYRILFSGEYEIFQHYENMPIKYTENLTTKKNERFQIKNSFFVFLLKT